MWQRAVYFLIPASLLLAHPAESTAIRVPADQPTIQAGIDAASESDTVLVAPGTYTGDGNRDLDFGGKNLVLKSTHGPEETIIDCGGDATGPHRGFIFQNQEDSSSVVDGFTITRGVTDARATSGGAVRLLGSSPTFKRCYFEDNVAGVSGGAVYLNGSQSSFESCDFENNWCPESWSRNCWWHPAGFEVCECIWLGGGSGGAVACEGATPTFSHCRFSGNHANIGGAFQISYGSSVTIHNSVIAGNSSISTEPYGCDFIEGYPITYGGGFACDEGSSLHLNHCTIVGNYGWDEYGPPPIGGAYVTLMSCIVAYNGGDWITATEDVTLSKCNVFRNSGPIEDQAGINGNISADPLFCDRASGDYRLDAASPCLPAPGSGGGEWMGALSVGCGDYVCGDVNWDGVLSEADLARIKELYFFHLTDWFLPVASSDMDCDGVITIADLARLVGYVYGYGPEPCCAPPPTEITPDSKSATLR